VFKVTAVCAALLFAGSARADEAWNCTLLEDHQSLGGHEIVTHGGGPYLIQVKGRAINLLVRGKFIIGFDVTENSKARLAGARHYDLSGGESSTGKFALDKRTGRADHFAFVRKKNVDEATGIMKGSCAAAAR